VVVSCCSETIPDDQLQYSSSNSKCCIDEFDYKKIEDIFSQSSNTVLISSSVIVAENNLNTIESVTEKKYSQNSNYNLPPPKFGKELLNTIHQLKLDLPVC
jgi:predicted transcriptional regulator